MRTGRIFLITVLMMGSFVVGAIAAANIEKVEAFLRRDFTVYVDGSRVDVGPVLIYNNTSYLPLKRVGELIGADVIWNGENKGIYVNPRFAGQPENPNVSEDGLETIRLAQPYAYLGEYRGATYPLLTNRTFEGVMYYRDMDIQRMGIQTAGLTKAKEQLTGELYVLESEVAAIGGGQIRQTFSYEPIVVGEQDAGKQKAIKDFIDYLPEQIQFLNRDNPEFIYYYPQILIVDAKGDDVYHMLSQERGTFVRYELTLSQNRDGNWRVFKYNTVNLE